MRRNQQGLLMEDAWERVRQKSGTSACLMERKAKATRKQSIWQRGGPPKGRESSDYNGLRKRGSPVNRLRGEKVTKKWKIDS